MQSYFRDAIADAIGDRFRLPGFWMPKLWHFSFYPNIDLYIFFLIVSIVYPINIEVGRSPMQIKKFCVCLGLSIGEILRYL